MAEDLEGTTKLAPAEFEAITEEIKHEAVADCHCPGITRAGPIPIPDSESQESLESTGTECLSFDIIPPPDHQLHGVALNDGEKVEQAAASAVPDTTDAGELHDEELTISARGEGASTVATQSGTKERLKVGSLTKASIIDLPREISDKIVQEVRHQIDGIYTGPLKYIFELTRYRYVARVT